MSRRRAVPPPASPANQHPWPNLQALIDSDGEITIGRIARFIDAATACDEHTTYAMLQRNDGESLVDVLTRLDQAVKQAIDEETTIDEINPP